MLPDGAFLYYYTHYFFYYKHYSSWLNRIAAPESTSYARTPILCETTSLWNIWEAAIAVESAQTVTIIRDYFALCHDYFPIIRIIPQPNVAFWLGIHCRLQPNCIIHHGKTVFAASSSGVDSIRYHRGFFSLNKADIGYTFLLSVHTVDVGKPPSTHGRTKLTAQVINRSGNRRPLVRPNVISKSKILTILQ
jgi:hypothetical protein